MCMSCINDLRIWKNTFLLKLRDQGPGFRFSFKLLSSSQSSLILMQNLVSEDRGLYNTSLRAPFKKYRHFFQIKFFKFKSRYFWWISSHHFFIELEIFATFLKRCDFFETVEFKKSYKLIFFFLTQLFNFAQSLP